MEADEILKDRGIDLDLEVKTKKGTLTLSQLAFILWEDGYSQGEDEGYQSGHSDGYDEGYDAGYTDGQQESE